MFCVPCDAQKCQPSCYNCTHSFAHTACQGPSVADVVFLLDMALNGSQENLDHLKAFLEESVSALDIKENCMRVGLVAYSNETRVINSLSKGINKTEILQHIQDLSPHTGQAYTGDALRKTRKEVFSAQRGSRKNQGVPQIAVLVTHRASEDNVTKAAVNLRREGVTIFTMGIEGASQDQLEKIASHPAEQFASKLSDFSELATHNQTFLKKLRNQITHTVSVLSERTETLKSGKASLREGHSRGFFVLTFCVLSIQKGLGGSEVGGQNAFLNFKFSWILGSPAWGTLKSTAVWTWGRECPLWHGFNWTGYFTVSSPFADLHSWPDQSPYLSCTVFLFPFSSFNPKAKLENKWST